MADIQVPSIATATPAAADTVVGVQGGAVKRFSADGLGAVARDYTGGAGVFFRAKGSGISANATNFNFGVSTHPDVNLPSDPRENNVVSIGWNVANSGGRENTSEAAFRIVFEEHYVQGGYTAFEYHVECIDTSGVAHRLYSAFAPKDGGAGSGVSYSADYHSLSEYDGTQRIKFDLVNDKITFANGVLVSMYDTNNTVFAQQLNAAGDAWINLPYVDADDRLRSNSAKGVVFLGQTPTGGSYANSFAVIQATSLPANGILLNQMLPSVTGNVSATSASGPVTGDLSNYLLNNGSGNSVQRIATMAAGGDPAVRLDVAGGATWYVGIDNSVDDELTIGTNSPGTNNRLKISTAGDVSIPTVGTGLRIAEGSNAKQGVATLVGGAVTVSNTSVTANSRIFLTSQSDGGTPGFLRVSARTAGTSFTITSSSGTDTSVVAYQIFEPA